MKKCSALSRNIGEIRGNSLPSRSTIRLVVVAYLVLPCSTAFAIEEIAAENSHPKYQKRAEELFRRLGRLQPQGAKDKADSDHYVIGTVELNKKSGQADVKFVSLAGQKEAAMKLTDFEWNSSNDQVRLWQVLFRVKDEATAQQAIAYSRKQYDATVEYRKKMMAQLQAQTSHRIKTTRRC